MPIWSALRQFPMSDSPASRWAQPKWRAEAEKWISSQLERRGIRVLAPIQQPHVRPWSTVLRVPTSQGNVFFKAATPALAYEAGVVDLLSRWRPKNIPEPLAVDRAQGWLLMRDGGPRLRELFQAELSISHWERLLREYAQLQLDAAAHTTALLDAGLIDRRLKNLPEKFDQLLQKTASQPPDPEEALSGEELGRLQAFSSRVAQDFDSLAVEKIPETIDHGDFHDGNIFVRGKQYLFFDWGDSSLTHPFFSLRTVFVSLENTFGVPEGSAAHLRLIDAYLEPFTVAAPRSRLTEAFQRAQRLAPIIAALRWQISMELAEDHEKQHYAAAVPSLMRELMDLNRLH